MARYEHNVHIYPTSVDLVGQINHTLLTQLDKFLFVTIVGCPELANPVSIVKLVVKRYEPIQKIRQVLQIHLSGP